MEKQNKKLLERDIKNALEQLNLYSNILESMLSGERELLSCREMNEIEDYLLAFYTVLEEYV